METIKVRQQKGIDMFKLKKILSCVIVFMLVMNTFTFASTDRENREEILESTIKASLDSGEDFEEYEREKENRLARWQVAKEMFENGVDISEIDDFKEFAGEFKVEDPVKPQMRKDTSTFNGFQATFRINEYVEENSVYLSNTISVDYSTQWPDYEWLYPTPIIEHASDNSYTDIIVQVDQSNIDKLACMLRINNKLISHIFVDGEITNINVSELVPVDISDILTNFSGNNEKIEFIMPFGNMSRRTVFLPFGLQNTNVNTVYVSPGEYVIRYSGDADYLDMTRYVTTDVIKAEVGKSVDVDISGYRAETYTIDNQMLNDSEYRSKNLKVNLLYHSRYDNWSESIVNTFDEYSYNKIEITAPKTLNFEFEVTGNLDLPDYSSIGFDISAENAQDGVLSFGGRFADHQLKNGYEVADDKIYLSDLIKFSDSYGNDVNLYTNSESPYTLSYSWLEDGITVEQSTIGIQEWGRIATPVENGIYTLRADLDLGSMGSFNIERELSVTSEHEESNHELGLWIDGNSKIGSQHEIYVENTLYDNASYQFSMREPGQDWVILQEYSEADYCSFTPSTAGEYDISVLVKVDGLTDPIELQDDITILGSEFAFTYRIYDDIDEIQEWDISVAALQDGWLDELYDECTIEIDRASDFSYVEIQVEITDPYYINADEYIVSYSKNGRVYTEKFTSNGQVRNTEVSDLTNKIDISDLFENNWTDVNIYVYTVVDETNSILSNVESQANTISVTRGKYVAMIYGSDALTNKKYGLVTDLIDLTNGGTYAVNLNQFDSKTYNLDLNGQLDTNFYLYPESSQYDLSSFYHEDISGKSQLVIYTTSAVDYMSIVVDDERLSLSSQYEHDVFGSSSNIVLGDILTPYVKSNPSVDNSKKYHYLRNFVTLTDDNGNEVHYCRVGKPTATTYVEYQWISGNTTVLSSDRERLNKYLEINVPTTPGTYTFNLAVSVEGKLTNLTQQITVVDGGGTVSPVELDSLSTNITSGSSEVNEAITLMASANGGSNVQYQFWVKQPGGVWEIVQAYGSVNTTTYIPSLAGTYEFGVWVIDDNNSVEQVETITHTVNEAVIPVTLNALSTNMSGNTSEAGQAITLNADITGGSNVQYQYWVMQPSGTWEIAQSYSSTGEYIYTPKVPGAYKFGVWVIDDNNAVQQVQTIDYTVTGIVADPVKLNGLKTNMTGNTSEAGQVVTLSGDITGGSNIQYQYWVMQPGGAWEIAQAYSSIGTFAYTPKLPGVYKFGIWVIDDNNTVQQVQMIDYTVTGAVADPVKLNGLKTNMTGNTSEAGQVVTLSADITGGSNVQYQYWVMKPDGAWEIGQSYASTENFAYTPKAPGVYKFGIWVIDDNNASYQVDIIDYTVTGTAADPVKLNGLNTNKTGNTSEVGQAVTLSADITGGSNVQYQYWVMKPGGAWEIAQSYASTENFVYTPKAPGAYKFGIWVIDDNNASYQVEIIDYTVTGTVADPVKLNGLNTNKTGNTSEAGQAVTLSADIIGGSNVQYQYWVMQPGGAWEIGQSYASTETFAYTPKAPGAYKFGIWVVDDNNASYQVEIIDYTVTGTAADPVKLNGLNTNMTGNTSETGQSVTLSADITGGSNVQYQYWVMQPGGAWEIAQSYASTETFAYTPKTPGAYKFGIWVIDDNNASYQVEIIDYTVTGEVADPVKLNSLSTNMTGNTGAKDAEVKLVADITGGSNVEYQFWVMQPGGAWEIVQVYSSTDTYTYTPRVAGVYQFGIWVIDDNNKTQQIDIINYTVTEPSGDLLGEEVKMSADEIVVEEEPVVEETPVTEEVQEEAIVEEPVVEETPATEEVQEEAIVEEPAVEETPAAEDVQEEAIVEEPAVEETPAAEEVQEEAIVEEPVVEETPVSEEVQEEAIVEEPVVEETPVTEEVQEEAIVEEPVVEETPATEEVQEEAIVEESVVEETPVPEEVQEEAIVEEPVVEETPATEESQEDVIVEEPIVEE